ncbi:MAG: hypothetical protein BV459_01515 [Thermoplasmata archaeon M11B2D]|nr:MAG: hypothetical protein BV459_01515 [Thermoplasmata archaeon M11B2D]
MSISDSYGDSSFLLQQLSSLGIDPEENPAEFRRFQLASISWVHFAEYFFKNPLDEDLPLKLDPPQKAAINAVQFGYDIDMYPWTIPVHKRPKEIVMIWPRQFGKTTAVAVAAACAFIFMVKRFNIATFSVNEDGAKELMDRIKFFIETSPFGYMIEDFNTTTIIKQGKRVRCTAYPASDGVRGRSVHLGLIDEAAHIKEKILMGAILYTLRRVGIRWIMLSTPLGFKGSFVEHYNIAMKTRPICCLNCGSVFEQTDSIMKIFIHKFGTYHIPDNMPRCPRCDAISWEYGVGEYCVIPVDPFKCSWKTKEQILHELELAGNTPLARQEMLGEIVMEGANVFTREMLENATNNKLNNIIKPDPHIRNYVVGMDFGKIHDASVSCVMHYDWARKKAILDHLYIIPATYQNIDYRDIRDSFLGLVEKYDPMWVCPDATGVGDSVADDMWLDLRERRLRARIYSNKSKQQAYFSSEKMKHKGFIFDIKSKLELINNLVEGFTARRDIEIPPRHIPVIDQLWEELLKFSFVVTDNKNIKYGTQNFHDDTVIALALSYWVARQRPFVVLESAWA